MKAMLHGLPSPFITVDGHYEKGQVWTWENGNTITEYEIYECDPIGDNPETQLQNVYLREVEESE